MVDEVDVLPIGDVVETPLGRDLIVPTEFDPRLLVARVPKNDWLTKGR